MFLDEMTKEKLGYNICTLSIHSHKTIYVQCDYCNSIYQSTMKIIHQSNSLLHKHACKNCRYKKRADVSLLQFGVNNSAQRPEVKDKIRAANSDRLKSTIFKQQAQNTNIKKFGTTSAIQSPAIKEKLRHKLMKKYGVDNIMKLKAISTVASQRAIETKIKKGTIISLDNMTRPELAKQLGFSRSHFGKLVSKYGLEKAMTLTPTESSLEVIMSTWLKSENIEFTKQVRIDNKIADFVIGDLIIEVDGLYWHSDANKIDNNYHAVKQKTYKHNGYNSLFFREHEIRDHFPIVQSIICNKLNKTTNIMARKCTLNKVSKSDAKIFLLENHLMGKGAGNSYGLYYHNELVMIMTIKKTKFGHEISRLCSKLFTHITGGFSRLLKYIQNQESIQILDTFIDLRYGTGTYLSNLGFNYVGTFLSFKWTDGVNCFNRMKFPGNSGYKSKLNKIWDCGQARFRCTFR